MPAEGTDNAVELQGELSAPPDVKSLPSGEDLVLLRLLVERPAGDRRDSLPIVVGPPPPPGRRRDPGQATRGTVRRAAGLEEGERVTVRGWLQRHFWDAGDAGRRSRLQVVATEVTRQR